MTDHSPIPDAVIGEAWSEYRYPRPANDDPTPRFNRALAVVAQWLRGKAVVSFPEPDRTARVSPPTVWWDLAGISIAAFPHHGTARVAMEFGVYSIDWPADVARDVFTAGLAACAVAEHLTDEHTTRRDTGEVSE